MILVLYLIGFFVGTGIQIKAAESQTSIIRTSAFRINNFLYQSWIEKLDLENPVKKTWIANAEFWCIKIDSCNIVDEHGNKIK